MRHRILTCKNHPNLRWQCKEIAWSEGTGYNGSRNIFFRGIFEGMNADSSWIKCSKIIRDKNNVPIDFVEECSCPASDLILAPEDALVK